MDGVWRDPVQMDLEDVEHSFFIDTVESFREVNKYYSCYLVADLAFLQQSSDRKDLR